MVQEQARSRPDDIAFTFLEGGEGSEANLTFAELDRRARRVGALLQATGKSQDRAVLLYPSGLEYIVAFFGTLYAGSVAVTAYPPDASRLARTVPRLEAIIADCDARFVLTTASLASMSEAIFELAPGLRSRQWIATDQLDAEGAWERPKLSRTSIAFIQYTSGSTGTPKGVVLTHGNLLANEWMLQQGCWTGEPFRVMAGWLPLFHDMGLMTQVILPIGLGTRSVLMAPTDFLTRPARWLEAVSRYRAEFSASPNFAFDLCARKVTAEERAKLDLSSWKFIINGAEPVRHDTIERFVEAFAPHGLIPSAVHPGYGLAEATVLVSVNPHPSRPLVQSFDTEALEQGLVKAVEPGSSSRTMVGSGPPVDQRAVIVDPETCAPCVPDRIGEIWLHGPNVGSGYWHRAEETERTFRGRIASEPQGDAFLRTGDLGFLHDGQLFIAGRFKDLIIVRGRNHYPQDIERTVEDSDPTVRKGCCAAFSVPVNGEERLVVMVEVEQRFRPDRRIDARPPAVGEPKRSASDRRSPSSAELGDVDAEGAPFLPDAVIAAIRGAVSEAHELQLEAVILLRARSIPKTSSGKIQRRACRAGYLDGSIDVLARSAPMAAPEDAGSAVVDRESFRAAAPEARLELALRLVRQVVARYGGVAFDALSADAFVNRLGVDSLGVIEIADEIAAATGVKIDSFELLRDITLRELAQRIATPQADDRAAIPELVPRADGTRVPLTFAQRILWGFEQRHPGTPTWNLPMVIRITGPFDRALLQQAMSEVVRRHDALRAGFQLDDAGPVQIFHPPTQMRLEVTDLRSLPDAERAEAVQSAVAEERQRLFDLFGTQGPTPFLRTRLLQTGASEHILLWVAHHLIIDGGSINLFFDEVIALYTNLAHGAPSTLSPIAVGYGDFAAWQRDWLEGDAPKPMEEYWRKQLSGAVPFVWPADVGLPESTPIASHEYPNFFPRPVVDALQSLATQEGATLAMILMTALKACARRWTGNDDITVALPASTRRQSASLAELIGNYTDTVALRSNFSGGLTFRGALEIERRVAVDAYANADWPAERAVACESAFDSPLMGAMMNMQPAWPDRRIVVPDGEVTFAPIPAKRAAVPWQPGLFFLVIQLPDGLLTFTHFFSRGMTEPHARRFADELHANLLKWAADPDALI
jgi:acyl-CoA synthetase (AMP-forming)/AMP-acid ligase II/acyl carrier protein